MKATVLVDNISCNELAGEWGLSIYIEYGDKKILLDTGASELFLENAEKMGVSIKECRLPSKTAICAMFGGQCVT